MSSCVHVLMTLNCAFSVTRRKQSWLEMCITDMQHWMEAHRLQLNADKTDLLWAGSGCGPAFLGSSGLSLNLGTETIRDSDHLCLESQHLLTSALRNMFLVYAQHASTGSLRFVIFDDFLTPSLQQHLYMLSLYLIMTNHWNKEVWLWFVSPASLRATLAGNPSMYPV